MASSNSGKSERPTSRLDVTFDTLIRRVEHAQTLHERQLAIDSLFERRRASTPSEPIVPVWPSELADPSTDLPAKGGPS